MRRKGMQINLRIEEHSDDGGNDGIESDITCSANSQA